MKEKNAKNNCRWREFTIDVGQLMCQIGLEAVYPRRKRCLLPITDRLHFLCFFIFFVDMKFEFCYKIRNSEHKMDESGLWLKERGGKV